MQKDTRQLLRTGSAIFLTGAVCVLLMYTVLGGITDHGPQTNSGWMALIIAIGCLPLGTLTLLLAFAKLFGEWRRR